MALSELEIRSFFSTVETKIDLIKQVREIYGKEMAPNFNSLDFWRIDENKISQILAYFLDPKEKHGQGEVYLNHFLKRFELDFFRHDDLSNANVFCEASIDNRRRIDILVTNGFGQCIGIENKIHLGTADQKDQIKDYVAYLGARYKNGNCLIYLSPKEKEVSEHSISKEERVDLINENKLKILNYEDHIIDCLSEFEMISKNHRVKSFLQDVEKKLRKMYMGEKDISEKQAIVDFINKDQRNIEIAFLVQNSLSEVKKDLRSKFEDQIKEVAKRMDIRIDGLKLYPSNWKNHKICFSYEGPNLLYGIQRNNADKFRKRFSEIEELIYEEIHERFNVSEWWPMYQVFYGNIEGNMDLWVDIKNGKAVARAENFVRLIVDNFNSDKY